jgi:hypothetical protein
VYSKPSVPRSIGGVLDDGFRLGQAAFSKTWPLALLGEILAALPLFIFKTQSGAEDLNDVQAYLMLSQSPEFALLYVVFTFAWFGLQNAITVQTVGVALGIPRTVRESMLIGFRLLPRAIFFWLLMAFGILLIATCFIIPGRFLGDTDRVFFLALSVVPLGFYLGRIFLANSIFVLEDIGAYASLLRSWHLTQGHFWRSGAILSLLGIIFVVAALVAGLVTSLAAGVVIAVLGARSTTTLIMVELISAVATMAFMPFTAAVLVSIYYDLKLRKEGS